MPEIEKEKVIALLNEILAHELAGVARYTHYAFMATGFSRIPIVGWANENADESLSHARMAGEHIVGIGGHPATKASDWQDPGKHDTESMLRAALEHERFAVEAYTRLLGLVEGKDVTLEEYARSQVATETEDMRDIEKMLRAPGR